MFELGKLAHRGIRNERAFESDRAEVCKLRQKSIMVIGRFSTTALDSNDRRSSVNIATGIHISTDFAKRSENPFEFEIALGHFIPRV